MYFPGNAWRYVFHQGRWWYWSASECWSYFDGKRWIGLDSLNQPIRHGDDPIRQGDDFDEFGPHRLKALPGPQDVPFRFGELPTPRSRAGSFDTGAAAPITARNFAGAFGTDSPSAVLPPHTEPKASTANPYGPGGAYSPYGSTNPLRGGDYTGAGGNYGYGLGAQRPAFGGYGRPSYQLFRQQR
ncbi:MAG TPA: hypothetical protein VGX76_24695 [Pirellulales bacterium]|nr:hypothetical protein [Pirellulales bacterium]